MRVLLLTPWDNAWVPLFRREVENRGGEFALAKNWNGVSKHDIVIHGWASGATHPVPGATNIMFMRRYELFAGGMGMVDWKKIDHLICVNTWIAGVAKNTFKEMGVTTPISVIYNAADTGKWTFKQRTGNHRIGMACHIHPKKNLPLALQILAELPEKYELHIAGQVQDPCTAEYLNHIAKRMRRAVYLYGHVDDLNEWWETMGCCLSTSLSEGNPNNVIEAMAKGIKPVVHRWPGAEVQFPPECLFTTAKGAADIITRPSYESIAYRQWVDVNYSDKNIKKVVDMAVGKIAKAA